MTSAQQQMFSFATAKPTAEKPSRSNLVIEAGAGTGKTTAIVAEVLRILLADANADPERIVLVTFTEKAAAEIADRIHSALTEISLHFDDERVVWPIGSATPLFEVPLAEKDAYRATCANQLARMDGLRSQTIHSFCQSLLRQHAIEAGLDPQFRVIEGFERGHLYSEVYDAWIDRETRIDASPEVIREWEVLLEHSGYLFLARGLIFRLVDRRDLLIDSRYTIGEVSEVEGELRDALRILRDSTGAQSPIIDYVRANSIPPAGTTLDSWIEYFAPIAPVIRTEDLRRGDGTVEAMKVLRTNPKKKGESIFDLLISHRAAVALLSLTRRFISRLDAEKRARGVLDFDDLLIQTLTLLDNTTVLERVRQQFDYLFVDEFQDTDRIQAAIIDRIARDRAGAYVAGKTVVVGDPKQSIYGFRRADPELYNKTTVDLQNGGAALRQLDEQYRSEPALLKAVNSLAERVLAGGEPDPNVFRPRYHQLRAARTQLHPDDAPITLLGCDADEGEERFTREAEVIAQWIASREKSELGFRRFAILFRRMTHIDAFLDVFDRQGIPYVLPPTKQLLNRPAPVDLLAVLRAIAYPNDRGAEISAGRSPYFALTDSEIVAAGETYDGFLRTIRDLRDLARHRTVSQMIDDLIALSGIEKAYDACADSGRSVRHLEHLRAIAFEYDQSSGGSLRQFVDEIDRRREEPDEVEPPLFDETKDAVRILTVHGAKGLEFETVILPDLEFGSQGASAFTIEEPPTLVLRNGVDSLSGYGRFSGARRLRDVGGLRDDAETRRLFYVAITRARRDVAFVCNITKPRKSGFAKYLYEALEADASMWPEKPGRVATVVQSVNVAFECMPRLAASATSRQRLIDREIAAELIESEPLPLPSHQVPAIERREPTYATPAHRAAGILLHRVLERWDGKSPFDPLLAVLSAEVAADNTVSARVAKRLKAIASSEMLRRIANAETIGREMPLSFLDDNGVVVEKRLDRLIRENGVDIVVDYKSGEPAPDRLVGDREQVALYCRTMERLTGRAHQGVLWYIDDERDVVVAV